MFEAYWPLIFFVPVFILIFANAWGPPKPCPHCGAPLPGLQSPLRKSRRQWLHGGYKCDACGGEADVEGRAVAAGPAELPWPIGLTIAAALVLPAVGLIVGLWWLR